MVLLEKSWPSKNQTEVLNLPQDTYLNAYLNKYTSFDN